LINKSTIDKMKEQIKVDNTLIKKTKDKILNKKHFNYKYLLIPATSIIILLLISIIKINSNKLPLNLLDVSVYAMENDNYYLTSDYEKETVRQPLKPNIEVKLAKYNKAMSSVPGIPINFNFNTNNIDYIKISIDGGTILTWNIKTGFINNIGDNISLHGSETLYFYPNDNALIEVIGVKNNIEIFKKNIKIIIDKDYNYYANISK